MTKTILEFKRSYELSRLYSILHYIGADSCGSLPADEKHLGNYLDPCVGKHCFGGNVYIDIS